MQRSRETVRARSTPAITVVVPTLDEADEIAGALASAAAPGVERIVVDGGSLDGTPEVARAAGADRVVRAPRGRAAQLARGLAEARGEIVLFLHADTRLPPGWADAVRGAMADPRVAVGAFRLRYREPTAALALVAAGANLRSRLARLPYGDQALFARASDLRACGGVPQVPIFEDAELVRALGRRGRLAILPLAVETSGRRYLEAGVARTVARNAVALLAYALGVDPERIARWYRGERSTRSRSPLRATRSAGGDPSDGGGA